MQCSTFKIVHYTKKALENDVGARTFDSDKSAPHFTSFQIESECTIKRPVYFKLSQQFQLQKHRFKLRKNATLSDLVFKIFLAVPTSKTSFQIESECNIKRSRFQFFLSSSSFQNIISYHMGSHGLLCTAFCANIISILDQSVVHGSRSRNNYSNLNTVVFVSRES